MFFLARAYAGVLGFVGRKNACACIYIYICVCVPGGSGEAEPPEFRIGILNLELGS